MAYRPKQKNLTLLYEKYTGKSSMRRARPANPWTLLLSLFLLTGCSSLVSELQRIENRQNSNGNNTGATTPAPTLTYSLSATWFFQNIAITPLVPTITGTISTCTASPTLPVGLSIAATTCTISGTPTTTQAAVTYTITATGSTGSATAQLTLRIANATATRVYGQLGSFTCNVVSNNGACASGAISANNFNNPEDVALDAGGIYVNDRNNSRVLYYSGTSTTPIRVYGQAGSLTCGAANNSGACASGGISANNLNIPEGIAVDSGGIYIADSTNNRVLHYSGTSTTADRVYGQFGAFTCSQANNNGACSAGAASANSLNTPLGVFLESGGVYIVDSGNHRVLHYSGTSTTADRVYGQLGSFSSAAVNNGGLSASSLNNPVRGAADSSGMYIVDYLNNRVLHYSGTTTTADRVYGQGGSFTCSVVNNNGSCVATTASANTLNNPYGVALDTSGVYIVDRVNHRLLHYSGTSTTADRAYGQGGSLTSSTGNFGGVTASSIFNPSGIAVDSSGIYLVDYSNQRVLFY